MSGVAIRYLALEACDGPFGSSLTSSHYTDEGTRVIRLGNIGTGRWRGTTDAYISDEYASTLAHHRVEKGDVVVAGLGDGNHPLGRACEVPDEALPAIVKADCFRLRLDATSVDRGFFVYAMNAVGTAEADRRSHGSTRSRLPLSSVLDIKLPLPPLEVQRRVADMLDVETARIDTLIDKNQRVLDRLKARDISAVTHRVVGDLGRPSRSAHDSAFWLGGLPADWHVAPLGMRYAVELGKMVNAERREGGDQHPYLANVDVQWGRVDTGQLRTMHFEPDEWARYGVEPGDVLICEGGEVGRAAVWPEEGTSGIYFQKALHRARPLDAASDNPYWLYYCLFAAAKTGVFLRGAESSTIDHLTGERLREHRFPFPPRSVQDRMVEEIDEALKHTADLRVLVGRQNELLRLRRQALITAAVTGQIDV